MKRTLNLLFATVVLSFASFQLFAQETQGDLDQVVVVLKSGTMFEGSLKNWTYGEAVTITTATGNEYTFPAAEVEKVVQKSLFEQTTKSKRPYNFKEKGRYYAVRAQFIKGNFGQRANDEHGVGGSIMIGQRYNRLLGVGIGAGYDHLVPNTGEKVVPIFVEASGYLTPSHVSLYYNVAAGYSLAFSDEDYNISSAKGGLMAYPSVGVRFGKDDIKATFDIGYKFQKAAFTYTDQWERRNSSEQRLLYKRLTLRFGLLF